MDAREATKETLWLWHILEEIGIPQSKPMCIYCESQSCIAMTKHLEFHGHSDEVQYHFIWKKVEAHEIEFIYCPTNVMVVDISTKSLPYFKLGFCEENPRLSESTPTKAIDKFLKRLCLTDNL